jgi:deoxyribodipyrimidine photo-lyase
VPENGGVPEIRMRAVNDAAIREDCDYVLYWMIAYRRTRFNFSLDRAIEWARRLRKPLVVFEPLTCSYPWASDRLHQFVIDGMNDNALALAKSPATYLRYIEPRHGKGKRMLDALSSRACVVVTDDFPAFFLPHLVRAAAERLDVRLEAVDSNGLLPLRAASRVYPTAATFRRHLQRALREHLVTFPKRDPFKGIRLARLKALPRNILERWPDRELPLEDLPIDHSVPAAGTRGGMKAGCALLKRFLTRHLDRYASERSHPDAEATSDMSPYLHFGHVSAHEIFAALAAKEDWSVAKLPRSATGKREGWWKMRQPAEAFLDELVTWRELGFNFAAHRGDYDQYGSLPSWARSTLEKHELDRRDHRYNLRQFESAQTHDPLWNAAQRELVRDGRIHGYLRMLWGKKILEWSASPADALRIMIELNNKYALDGRDPNSYSGIFWILGRYDRPWPERPIFGTIRYMSSESARRKLRLKKYLEEWGDSAMKSRERDF